MKRFLRAFVAILAGTLAGTAVAHTLKSWGTEILTPTDLNNNFLALHNHLHGNILNADISSIAAIGVSKLGTPFGNLKWAKVNSSCGASPCTIAAGSGFTSITRSATGTYTANFAAMGSANFLVLIGAEQDMSSQRVVCHEDSGTAHTTATVTFMCFDTDATAANVDSGFSIIVIGT